MSVGRAIELADCLQGALLAELVQRLEVAAAREHGRVRRLHHHAVDMRRGLPAPVIDGQRIEHFAAERV